jgi:hypothetical protein
MKSPLATNGGEVKRFAANAGGTGFAIAAVIATCVVVWAGVAGSAEPAHWATGPAVQQALAQQIDIMWSGNPLRQALGGLSRAQRVAILIDRRVDPGQKLDLKLDGVPMWTALEKIAAYCGLGVSRLGPVVYIGPTAAAERLPALAAALERDVRRLPTAARPKFLQTKSLAWDDLANPRDLLAELGRQSGIDIGGLEQLPYDLWAEADLPPLSLVDRLVLIATQFDLSFTMAADGREVKLVPVAENVRKTAAEQPRAVVPQPTRKRSAAKPSATEEPPIKRFAVKEKPLEPVLRELGKQLDLEMKIDRQAIEAAGISLDQQVSAVVEQATVDELLRELLKSTGLTFHRRQKVVEIVPAK